MKRSFLILWLLFSWGAKAGPWDTVKKDGFFAVDFINGFTLPEFKHFDTRGYLKYGGKLFQQSAFELGIEWSWSRETILTIQYSYDFIRGSKWTPGFSASLFLGGSGIGYNLRETKDRKLTFGGGTGLFLRRTLSKHTSLLVRTGVRHKQVLVKDPEFSKNHLTLYIGVGFRVYLF